MVDALAVWRFWKKLTGIGIGQTQHMHVAWYHTPKTVQDLMAVAEFGVCAWAHCAWHSRNQISARGTF
jgi:hypothetical protein